MMEMLFKMLVIVILFASFGLGCHCIRQVGRDLIDRQRKLLFDANLIPGRQFNDFQKSVCFLLEQIRKLIANCIDCSEEYYCLESIPIEVCSVSKGKRCQMGRHGSYSVASTLATAHLMAVISSDINSPNKVNSTSVMLIEHEAL